jgi:hypothetical protein
VQVVSRRLVARPLSDDRDQLVLDLRSIGRSFAFIARTLNMAESADALAAFLRAVDASPSHDRPRLWDEELARLQALEDAVRVEGALSPFDFDRQLLVVKRMRAELAKARTAVASTRSEV